MATPIDDTKVLSLESQSLSTNDEVLRALGDRRDWELINLSYNNLEATPPCLLECKNLKALNLCGNKIKSISNLPSTLENLLLSENPLENLNGLLAAPNLERLSLAQTHITDLSALCSLKNIAFLYLGGSNILEKADDNFKILANLQELQTLDLTDIYCSVSDLLQLENCPKLSNLQVADTPELHSLVPIIYQKIKVQSQATEKARSDFFAATQTAPPANEQSSHRTAHKHPRPSGTQLHAIATGTKKLNDASRRRILEMVTNALSESLIEYLAQLNPEDAERIITQTLSTLTQSQQNLTMK